MGKIVFNVSSEGRMSVKGNDMLANALTPRVHVEWFSDKEFMSDGNMHDVWTDELEMAARINYIIMDGEVRECLIYNASKSGIVMKLKVPCDGVNLMETIYPEDKDVMYTTREEAERALSDSLVGADRDSLSADTSVDVSNDVEKLSVSDQIKKLNSEKMSYMAKIKAINNKIKRLQEQL